MSLADVQTQASNAAAAILREDYAAAERYARAGLALLAAIPTVRHADRAVETVTMENRFKLLLQQCAAARKAGAGLRFTSTTRAPLTR